MALNVLPIDALSPVPEITILEIAVLIVFARRPGMDLGGVASEITRWFHVDVAAADVAHPVRRLQHRTLLEGEGATLRATEHARAKAEAAARGIVHLTFRDKYFFDVGKLLDVTIREDKGHAL